MEKYNLITNSAVELGDDLTTEGNGKGRKFVSKFIEPGVASYEQFGDVLITKETLDKFIQSMVGCPVIIKHKDITDENADKERVGVVSDVWFNETDGWFYCSGIIWDKQAIDLVKNQGWNVSCTYDFESDKEAKTHNGKKIDMEFTGGNFLHLALVDNPRYERANIVMNSKVENEDQWITIKPNGEENKGRHLLIKEGETVQEAMERTYGIDGAKGQQKLFDTKGDRKTKEDFKREAAEKQAKYDEIGKKREESLKKEAAEKEAKKRDDATKLNEQEFFNKYYDSNSLWELHEYWEQAQKQKEDSYYEPDMEEHYTKAYEDSISKDFDEFMKSRKEEKKDTYYEPDMEETYTKSYEDAISKDYDEFMKAQKYKSGVDSAEKRRIIDRVIDLHSRATSTKPASEQTDYGFSVERNKDLNRLQLKFDNIPDANTRAILKSNGFRWSPREKAWQRQLGDNSERSLKYVMEKMKVENALLEGIEGILTEHNISNDDLPILTGLYNILKD